MVKCRVKRANLAVGLVIDIPLVVSTLGLGTDAYAWSSRVITYRTDVLVPNVHETRHREFDRDLATSSVYSTLDIGRSFNDSLSVL
jgi:hypothetical protein